MGKVHNDAVLNVILYAHYTVMGKVHNDAVLNVILYGRSMSHGSGPMIQWVQFRRIVSFYETRFECSI